MNQTMRCVLLIGSCVFHCTGCTSREQVCGETVPERDNTAREITVLVDDLSPLRTAFNSNSHQWRVLALVSPTCSECVLGAEAVDKQITARYPASQVGALIVWIPMLPSDSEQGARASATMFPPQRAAQFYDAKQALGTRYAQQTFAGFYERARKSIPDNQGLAVALDDRIEQQRPQWDLYMLYAPGVRWEEFNDAPPMPTHWIRHLGRKADGKTSTYWQDSPESGPHEGDLHAAIRGMADQAIGKPQAMESAMKIEVLGFDGCPNTPQTRTNVAKAVKSMGLAATVVYVDQEKLQESDVRRGWPTPTVLIDGRDLFGMPAPKNPAMGCRVYKFGAPSEAEIAAALRAISR